MTTIIINIIVTAIVSVATSLAVVAIIVRHRSDEYKKQQNEDLLKKFNALYDSQMDVLVDFYDRVRGMKITADKEYKIVMHRSNFSSQTDCLGFSINDIRCDIYFKITDDFTLYLYYPDGSKHVAVFDKGVLDISTFSSVVIKSYTKKLKENAFAEKFIDAYVADMKDEKKEQ